MKSFVLACLALILSHVGFCQAPVAGLDSSNAVVSLSGFVGEFGLNIPNTSTGTIQSWRYVAQDVWGFSISDLTLTNPHANYFMNLNPPMGALDLLLKQIVTGPGGSDSITVRLPINCNVVTPAVQYWLTATSNLPAMTFCTATTDNAFGRDVFVYSPFLLSSGWHAQIGCGTDTFSLPGPVRVCGQFWDCTCCGITMVVCDTFNLPCWRNPVVGFSSAVNNLQVQFQSAVTATAGAQYGWDFGDGQTSNLASPSHMYSSSGSYAVCLTVTDTCGTSVVCDTVGVGAMGMPSATFSNVQIQPNPSSGQFTVAWENFDASNIRLRLTDLRGCFLLEEDWLAVAGKASRLVDAKLAPGVYLLSLESSEGGRIVRRIYVQ